MSNVELPRLPDGKEMSKGIQHPLTACAKAIAVAQAPRESWKGVGGQDTIND